MTAEIGDMGSIKNGDFSVKSISYKMVVQHPINHDPAVKTIWKGVVPYRIEIFVWIAVLERVNTREMRGMKGIIQHAEAKCGLCKKEVKRIAICSSFAQLPTACGSAVKTYGRCMVH